MGVFVACVFWGWIILAVIGEGVRQWEKVKREGYEYSSGRHAVY